MVPNIFAVIVSTLLVIQSSTSSSIENEKLMELTEQLNRLQAKSEADNEKWAERFEQLQAENSKQNEEITLLKSRQISNVESLLHSNSAPYYYANEMKNEASVVADGPSFRALTPPSTCQEMANNNNVVPVNATYLLKNNNKMQAVYCHFVKTVNSYIVSQQLIGNVDVKTKSVHFYVQKTTDSFKNNAIIPFELARLNEGGAMDLASGIFTAPVEGIYHFEFSGLKGITSGTTVTNISIYIQNNGANVGQAYAGENDASAGKDTISLTASLRLKPNERVNLYKSSGELRSNKHAIPSHFVGWLVEEYLI